MAFRFNPLTGSLDIAVSSGGGGLVDSVTGLNTDNTDPANPVIRISVDGVTITGDGTPGNPLVSVGGGSSDSFTIIQTDTGTSPTADSSTDTLTLTTDDTGTYRFDGDATTDTVELQIDDASVTKRGLVNTTTQTFNGVKTFDDGIHSPHIDAADSSGLGLRNASGTAQIRVGAGGGSNISLLVATTASSHIIGNSTDYWQMPSGTTAQRPTASNGMFRYNSTTTKFEVYQNGAWVNYEQEITAGTTAQYWRGDKTFQTLDKAAVGLSNVDNTSDANKPVSTATQTELDKKIISIPFHMNALSPADGTTYYFSGITNLNVPPTTATNETFSVGYAATLVGVVIKAHGNSTQGSNENVALSLRNTTTSTSSSIGNFKTDATSSVSVSTTITGVSISVAATDVLTFQMSGTWATNPVAVRLTGWAYFRI